MERRGIYRKGSAGHPRNINSYKFYRENVRKWRLPVTVVLALVFVFGAAPVVGDQFTASVLNDGSFAVDIPEDVSPEQFKKTLFDEIKKTMAECSTYELVECENEGKRLLGEIAQAQGNFQNYAQEFVQLQSRFEPEIAKAACKYDLDSIVLDSKTLQISLQAFRDRYGKALVAPEVDTVLRGFADLEALVDRCRLQ